MKISVSNYERDTQIRNKIFTFLTWNDTQTTINNKKKYNMQLNISSSCHSLVYHFMYVRRSCVYTSSYFLSRIKYFEQYHCIRRCMKWKKRESIINYTIARQLLQTCRKWNLTCVYLDQKNTEDKKFCC